MAKFTAGYDFAAATGLETGQHLVDMVEQAEPEVDLTDDSTLTVVGGEIIIKDDGVTNAKLAEAPALSLKGNATNAEANPTDIESTTDGHVLRQDGTSLAFGTLTQLSLPAGLFSLMGDNYCLQWGKIDHTAGTTGNTGFDDVTFPVEFAGAPEMIIPFVYTDQGIELAPFNKYIFATVDSSLVPTATGFRIRWGCMTPNSYAFVLGWVAIGVRVT